MKKSLLLTLALTSQVMAIENGTSLSWSQFSDMATYNCTGTLIGAKYLLTAGHCELNNNNILFSDGSFNTATVSNNPTAIGDPQGADISVWTLATPHESKHIRFIANLNFEPVSNNDIINIYGFAGTQQLKTAQAQIDISGTTSPYWYAANDIGNGMTQTGDSGGAWTNQNGEIVAVHNSGGSGVMLATRLSTVKDWLLSEINGWHYPMLVDTNSNQATITVQSLHTNVIADSAYTEGGITLIGGTCLGNNTISSFDKCTYIVEGSGEGKLFLSSSEYVHINKPAINIPDSNANVSDSGSSGGSLGLWGLLLIAIGWLRNRK